MPRKEIAFRILMVLSPIWVVAFLWLVQSCLNYLSRDPLFQIFPDAIPLEELSRSDVYVGNCCVGFQDAYYIPEEREVVQSVYEAELGGKFTNGGYPVHPNFEDFSKYPSSLWQQVCHPSCEQWDETTRATFILDAIELGFEAGTVIIIQTRSTSDW